MLREYLILGGPMMWPLLICSTLLLAVLFERTWTIGICVKLLGRSRNAAALGWHRRVFPFFVDVPPSLGLLGTVIGIVQSFALADGGPTGSAVGAGLAVACMTTIFGLGIAIVTAVSGYLLDWMVVKQEIRAEAKP